MKSREYKLSRKAPTPMVASYHPEMDVSLVLQITTSRLSEVCIIEIGREDITTVV
jgi:hypothetical protein